MARHRSIPQRSTHRNLRTRGAHRIPAPPLALRGRALAAAVAAGALAMAGQGLQGTATATASATAPTSRTAVEPVTTAAASTGTSVVTGTAAAPEFLALSRPPATGAVAALERAVYRAERSYSRPGVAYIADNDEDLDGWIAQALGLMGMPQTFAPGVKNIIMRESGGDPEAINLWDSNASAGYPSEGLMQVIPATFRSSVLPSLADRPITDPVANITAGVRAMIANHGIETVMDGGRRNSAGSYIGYGGAKAPPAGLPDDAVEYLHSLL